MFYGRVYGLTVDVEEQPVLSSRDKIRPASVAGYFYPADKYILERDLSLLLENSPEKPLPSPVRGMLVPHAGYLYSGGVAARAYRQIMNRSYRVAVILAPSHEEQFEFISIYPGRGFRTPLGDIAIEMNLAHQLVMSDPAFRFSEAGYASGEYALEVQLPFLKWVQDSILILPLMVGAESEALMQILVDTLPQLLDEENYLIIASSDLSRNHPDPTARSMDQIVVGHISRFDPVHLWIDLSEKRCEMCGGMATVAMMKVLQKLNVAHAETLLYRNSSDITGDKNQVEGYLSAIFY